MERTRSGSEPGRDVARRRDVPAPARRVLGRAVARCACAFASIAALPALPYADEPPASAESRAAPAQPQASDPEAPRGEPVEAVVVVGLRPGLASAQDHKRKDLSIVDSVVATDIGKLPDVSVSDALSRVTGVQIARDRGEGGVVTIRGLTQVEATLDGREVFTAGAGRTLDFADIPAELVSRIDVYKTASAERLEGGLGGLVDLRTRRPFDFDGGRAAASARLVHGDLAGDTRPQASLLLSDRWRAASGPELGVLASLAFQERPFREDMKSAGNPIARTDLFPGQTVSVPNGTSESSSAGFRRRVGGSLVVQARPTAATELYAEGAYAELRTRQDTYQMNAFPSSTFESGSPRLFPGTSDLQSVTWTNAPLVILSFARDTVDRTRQGAVGGSWAGERVSVRADVSDTRSTNRLDFSGLLLGGTAARFGHDLSPRVPGTSVTGTDLLDPSQLRVTGVAYRVLPYEGELAAARGDADAELGLGPLRKLAGGVRAARRHAGNDTGLLFGDAPVPSGGISASSVPALLATDPYAPFFPGSTSIGDYVAGNPAVLRDNAGLRAALGVASPVPTAGSPLGIWRVREDSLAAYALATFSAGAADGTLGVRAVETREDVSGNQSVPSAPGTVAPIEVANRYLDWLPALNVRWALGGGLVLRGAASKTLTRPSFDQLSPSLLLIPNSAQPALNQGSAGNPALRPIRSDNLDLAVEAYLGPATSVYVTGFLKKVDGFVATSSAPEEHDGATYQVTRPYNSNRADIRGLEVGYQQFYRFLPGPLRGVGLQANYTLVASETRDPVLGGSFPLQNLSRHGMNAVAMYELGGLSARLAWNWRDRYLSGAVSVVPLGTFPVYTRAYGWVDASVAYRLGRVSLALEGVNLLRTVRHSQFAVATRPQSAWLNDVQVSVIVTVRI